MKDRDTAPEMAVRRLLHQRGYRYGLHRSDLPGKPDLVFAPRQKVVFVHGCFWHGHSCKLGDREPKSNVSYWRPKIARNRERDAEHMAALKRDGWGAMVVWECELGDPGLASRLGRFLGPPRLSY